MGLMGRLMGWVLNAGPTSKYPTLDKISIRVQVTNIQNMTQIERSLKSIEDL